MDIPKDHQKFIIKKRVQEYDADEIQLLLREEKDLEMVPREESIQEFIEKEDTQDTIETKKEIKEKKAQITKKDLLETLVDLKDDLEDWQEELKDTEHGVTRNEAVNNMINVVNKIGELIGELDTSGQQGNVVKIDKVEQHLTQNITQVINHLAPEKKKNIVEQLEDDPDVEDFAIKRKN